MIPSLLIMRIILVLSAGVINGQITRGDVVSLPLLRLRVDIWIKELDGGSVPSRARAMAVLWSSREEDLIGYDNDLRYNGDAAIWIVKGDYLDC